VPFIVVSEDAKKLALRSEGSLQDISPTVLGMLGFDQPKEMTGKDLRKPVISA
jgi:2,3-bisphosphoglycerate-independent phosphoglycerate mutase